MVRWDAETLWQAIEPRLPGFTVEILPEVDSTNTQLLARLRADPTTPVTTTAAGTPGTGANPQRHTAAPTTPLTGTAQPGSAERRG